MPSNPRQWESKCWDHVYGVVKKIRKGVRVEYEELVHQCIRKYPVGAKQVDEHLQRFYISRGIISLDDQGTLYYDAPKEIPSPAEVDEELSRLGITAEASQ